jgi:hypothetical protein
MRKKMMLLAVAAVSAAILAIPGTAMGLEDHLKGTTSFTGTGGPGSLTATGEPTITCESTEVKNGVVETGGTTGSAILIFKQCHATIFGLTAKCRTTGSSLDNEIQSSGTYHIITDKTNNFIAILFTAKTTTVVCAGISTITVAGNVIGTITSPACGVASKELKLKFIAPGGTQEHLLYTGNKFDLTAQTSGGSVLTAGLNSEVTLNSPTSATIECT